MSNHNLIVPGLILSLAVLSFADEHDTMHADKSEYTLFNPTPRELMRELSADRPDATESPITVDAGHIQVEASFFDYTHDDRSGERLEAWTVMDTNVKLGLTNDLDMQFVFGAYSEEELHISGAPDEYASGFSDFQLRWKYNIWGNDGGTNTAFGVMPYITIPTGTELSTDEPEGGIIAMLGWDVAENWGVGGQVEIAGVHDDEDDDHDVEFSHTAVLGADIVGSLGAFVEYLGVANGESGQYAAFFNTGVTLGITDDFMLDAGVRIGLNSAAEDIGAFTGFTLRY